MAQLSLEEITKVFTDFLNESGEWWNFKEFVEKQGYKLEELGMQDE